MLSHYFTEENARKDDEVKTPVGLLEENKAKNRHQHVIPGMPEINTIHQNGPFMYLYTRSYFVSVSSKRVMLMTPVDDRNDYINAVFVDVGVVDLCEQVC